jgi:hypothetical protein
MIDAINIKLGGDEMSKTIILIATLNKVEMIVPECGPEPIYHFELKAFWHGNPIDGARLRDFRSWAKGAPSELIEGTQYLMYVSVNKINDKNILCGEILKASDVTTKERII